MVAQRSDGTFRSVPGLVARSQLVVAAQTPIDREYLAGLFPEMIRIIELLCAEGRAHQGDTGPALATARTWAAKSIPHDAEATAYGARIMLIAGATDSELETELVRLEQQIESSGAESRTCGTGACPPATISEEVESKEVITTMAATGQLDFSAYELRTQDIPLLKLGEQTGAINVHVWRRLHASDIVIQFNFNTQDERLRKLYWDVRFRLPSQGLVHPTMPHCPNGSSATRHLVKHSRRSPIT